jgi:hypothetical protein
MNKTNIEIQANEMRTHAISARVLWFAGALLTTVLTVGSVNHALAGKIYRCVDEQTKKVTMSDSACQYNGAKGASADKAAPVDGDKKDVGKKATEKKDADKGDAKAAQAPTGK